LFRKALEGRAGVVISEAFVGAPDIGLIESKMRPPRPRSGEVLRTGLVDRLEASTAPITSVVAPAGYGKTTLLAQWARRSRLPSSWISLDQHDNEPGVLLGSIVEALERIEPTDPEYRQLLLAEAAVDISWALRRLSVMVSAVRTPFLLLLDHVEAVENKHSGDLLTVVALNLPEGSRLALASRAEPAILSARLRVHGLVNTMGPDDLAMGEPEAQELLAGAGITLEPPELTEVIDRTEGWPVGIYLASFGMKAGGSGAEPARLSRADDRLLADYLRSEVLSSLAPSTVSMLTRTSILDRLCGPLCDAVTASTGAQQVLESLERSNMLLIPCDNQQQWYRCHPLLGELLRGELERTEPEMVSRLHDRAASWFEANGQPATALDHAQAAGDPDRAARLFGQIAHAVHGSGRAATVFRWLSWFDDRGLIWRYPPVAALGAILEAFSGGRAQSRLLADAVSAVDLNGPAPDGSPVEGWIALMEACLCRWGVDQMRDDAARSTRLLSIRSPLRGPATVLEGVAALLQGDLAAADSLLAAGAELSLRSGNIPGAASAVAERAIIAIERGDRAAASTLSDQAVTIVTEGHVEAYLQATVVYAAAARTAAHCGDMEQARGHVIASARLRPRCTAATPWSAQFLLQLGNAYLALGDSRGAHEVLRQVNDILHDSPDLGVVATQCAELSRMLDTISVESIGASSLTVAELRLLPLLATHLTYREIGERLYLSRNTIKSEAVSVLRKLGARTRSEAIETAERIGLLGR
jgi:LuxR family maltose regulon positive regulatory protein